jgi:hypothetical protein
LTQQHEEKNVRSLAESVLCYVGTSSVYRTARRVLEGGLTNRT